MRVQPSTGTNKLYHPACQCWAPAQVPPLVQRSGLPEWFAGGPVKTHRADARQPQTRKWERLVLVLRCQTNKAAAQWKTDLSLKTPLTTLPRVSAVDRKPKTSRRACVVSRTSYEALREIDEGLAHAETFWEHFSANTLKCCIGARGVSARMRSIQGDAAVAFALKEIVTEPGPSDAQVAALLRLYRQLKPDLQRRPWPPDSYEAAPARKAWPHERGIVEFYRRWWQNVYETSRDTSLPFCKRWRLVETVEVAPVRVVPQLAAVWQLVAGKITRKRKAADFASRLVVWKLVDMINSYDRGGCLAPPQDEGGCLSPPQGKSGVFQVAVKDLATTTPFTHSCPLGAGAVAKLRPLRLRNKLVRVVALRTPWDTRAIAASLQHDARFAKPAYYINVLFAMVVRFGNTSSPCERWAHELKLLWNAQKTQTTPTLIHRLKKTLIHRLHGRAAGFRGDGTDEALLEALEREMTLDLAEQAAHNIPRNRRGQALATWRAERRREFERAPARKWIQRALSAPTGSRRSSQQKRPRDARGESVPERLEGLDKELLSRIRRRERGLSAPGSAQEAPPDSGSVMPWCANTKAQWYADLATPRRLVMTSNRADDFFARRD